MCACFYHYSKLYTGHKKSSKDLTEPISSKTAEAEEITILTLDTKETEEDNEQLYENTAMKCVYLYIFVLVL